VLMQTQRDPNDGRLLCKITRQIDADGRLKTVATIPDTELSALFYHERF
jgi:hypothetical protein